MFFVKAALEQGVAFLYEKSLIVCKIGRSVLQCYLFWTVILTALWRSHVYRNSGRDGRDQTP